VLFYDLKSGLISIEYAAGVTPVEADTIYYLAASPASTEREQETPCRREARILSAYLKRRIKSLLKELFKVLV
jgi:hypothetical protein